MGKTIQRYFQTHPWLLIMRRKNRGEHICRIFSDAETEERLARKTKARDKRVRMEKLRNLDSEKAAEELVKILEQH